MRRGRRFAAQLVLLPALYLFSLPSPDVYTNVIYLFAVFTLPLNATVAAILIWSSRQAPEVETLRERADDAVTLLLMSIATSATAGVAIAMRLGFQFPGRPVLALLSWLALLIVVPAIGWMGTWRDVWLPIVRRKLDDEAGQDQ